MNYRVYNPEKDKEAVHRMWQEVGWIEKDNTKPMDILIEPSRTIVVDVNGEPECLVVSMLGDIDYIGEKLIFSCIAGVTTSLVARRQQLALKLTAARIALDVMDGAEVSGLGVFEQGFYDKLGFGTGGYEHIVSFSPSTLKIDLKPRVPRRLTVDDWEKVHRSRINRLRVHGSCNFESPAPTQAEMNWSKNGFGFGYFNDEGELTHHIWMRGKGKESGPFHIDWMVYRNYEQFLELLAFLRSFGEQIHLISIIEPPHVQFQDFLEKPLQQRKITEKSDYQNIIKAIAYWQMRICNLEACLGKTHLRGEDVRFNLILNDPIGDYIDGDFEWRGISGEYIVCLGKESHAERGSDDTVLTMHASVGAFTRMWLGVSSATVLSVSDDLSAPVELLRQLDDLLRLPHPTPDWGF